MKHEDPAHLLPGTVTASTVNGGPAHLARRTTARQADMVLALTESLLRESASREVFDRQGIEAIAELVHAATHDMLTGLPTRGVLLNRLELELARDAAGGQQVA